MNNTIFDEANRILGNFTPLKGDCGMLCGQKCCSGDERTGMLLFPNEETKLNLIEQNGRRLAICDGKCNRNERPLSCRIFPFFPVIINGKVRAVPDYRGINICPMLTHQDEIQFSRRFLRRVERVGELLYSDPECAKFMHEIAEEIEDIEKINRLFV